MTIHSYLVTTPQGLSELVAAELRSIGAGSTRIDPVGVRVRGPLQFGYRMCLWSRCASRVLLHLVDLVADDATALHGAIAELPWEDHLDPNGTLAVDFAGKGAGINQTQFGAQKVKDAIVDRLRAKTGRRPSVDKHTPDLRVNVYVRGRGVTVSLDLSGSGLHQRGYRRQAGPAPLRETLAAALLLRAGWGELAASGGGFVDPMCGAGSLVIEGALIATDHAPGLGRTHWGFSRWRGHDPAAWEAERREAEARRAAGRGRYRIPLRGYDRDPSMIALARANADRAGVADVVAFETTALVDLSPASVPTGLIATNPPHGERLGDKRRLPALYAELREVTRERYAGWDLAVLTTQDDLPRALGPRAKYRDPVMSGPLRCVMVGYEPASDRPPPTVDAHPFANRLRKNRRRLRPWLEREHVNCYRLYDADIPEYNVAVDVYEQWVHVQEYAPPPTVDAQRAAERRAEILEVLPGTLGVRPEDVFFKTRERKRGSGQYDKQASEGAIFVVREGGHRFWINLSDYIDTGLFLDHRITRTMLAELAPGRRFLNLFSYTGTATVYVAAAGARSTTSVDLSATYLDWTRRNLELAGITDLGDTHRLVRADCMQWLAKERERYDLIFVDPPTFSTSKAMRDTFDVQRDHVPLLERCLDRLRPGGILVFSTNARRFQLDPSLLAHHPRDLTAETTPPDFTRKPPHKSWKFER